MRQNEHNHHAHLEQADCASTHARVQVSLGALDVVVQVITECMDEIDALVAILGVKMTREQH